MLVSIGLLTMSDESVMWRVCGSARVRTRKVIVSRSAWLYLLFVDGGFNALLSYWGTNETELGKINENVIYGHDI